MGENLLNKWSEGLGLEKTIHPDEIPKIDLYMDQVIQLFENKFKDTVRNDKEKVLTKTMVNNYGKDKLFFPIKKKKYTREHILLIALIYHLKGALNIPDIKVTLNEANEKILKDTLNIEDVYQAYLHIHEKQVDIFEKEIENKEELVQHMICDLKTDDLYTEKLLMIASFVQMSTMYRKAAEKLIDEL